jgi:replication factor C subunit 1
MSHPLPFMKASNVTVTKKAASKDMPDLEEAIEEDDDAAVDDPAEDVEEDEGDITKDKYIKQPKKKAAPKKATKAKSKAKAADDDDDEDEPPAKGKGKGKAPAKPRGKAKK